MNENVLAKNHQLKSSLGSLSGQRVRLLSRVGMRILLASNGHPEAKTAVFPARLYTLDATSYLPHLELQVALLVVRCHAIDAKILSPTSCVSNHSRYQHRQTTSKHLNLTSDPATRLVSSRASHLPENVSLFVDAIIGITHVNKHVTSKHNV